MKKTIFIFLLFLSACATPTPGVEGVFNPSLLAVQAQLTSDAADNQAKLYSVMATGTAQAPIIHITETAAQLIVNGTQGAMDLTGTAIQWTPTNTPVPTITPTSTPNATMTLVFAQSYADATKVANTIIEDNQRIERGRITNVMRAVAGYTVALIALIVAVMFAYVGAKRLSHAVNPIDEHGKAKPMYDVLEGTVWDIERSANGMIGTTQKFLAQLPAITSERQEQVTARSQMVDMATRARLPRRLLEEQSRLALPEGDKPLLIDYPLPEWTHWMQNWKPGHIALGINEKGLLQTDPDFNPHYLFAGTTGSWKTRGGVRVVVTCALASGWQVVIAGKQLDYKVFENHPNAHLVPFSLLQNPIRAIELLRSVYGEIERRDRMMSQSGHSLWSDTGQSRTMVVVDEFSNLADALEDIEASRREELWRWARMDTAEARKYGMHMVYALQDPTAKSIDLRIRRNTTPVMFRVKDATSSRTLLNVGGAEMLSVRHFLASITKLERGAAFAPSDEEILQFLNAHQVRTDQQSTWIDAVVTDSPPPLPAPEPKAETLRDFLGSLSDDEAKIIDLYIEGKSQRKIEMAVFGGTGGQSYTKVSELIRRYKVLNSQPATATTAQNMPNLSAVAA